MTNVLMIDWENQRAYCESCNAWITADKININGTHDLTGINDPSAHTIWEKE